MTLVSIIVPIYRSEKYIEQCLVSLFEQDYPYIEYIFVNDATPDNAISILEETLKRYPARQKHSKIIHHSHNLGSGASRQTGIRNATGDYTIQIDSDDWCEKEMISSLLQKAKETKSEIVYCDFYVNFGRIQKYIKQKPFKEERLLNKIIEFEVVNSLANKLIKRSLYVDNDLYPPAHLSLAEDRWICIRLATLANKISYLNRAFFHYRKDNPLSITSHSQNKKRFNDLAIFLKETEDFLRKHRDFALLEESFYRLVLENYSYFNSVDKTFLKKNYPESLKFKYFMHKNVIKGLVRYRINQIFRFIKKRGKQG